MDVDFRAGGTLALPDGLRLIAPFTTTDGALRVAAAADGAIAVLAPAEQVWETVVTLASDAAQPRVALMPSGEVVVAAARSRRSESGEAELNGAVYDAAGRELRRFLLGDGVEDVQASADGTIWVSYFDEGTTGAYGRYGWGRLGPDRWVEPYGVAGLVRFDLEGNRLYTFEPPEGADVVVDCYALNVDGGTAWLSYHPFFPIVRVADGNVTAWRTGLPPVDAFAVAGDRVLACARGPEGVRRWFVARLGDAGIAEIVERPPPAEVIDHVIGRGRMLYAFGAESWYVLELAAP